MELVLIIIFAIFTSSMILYLVRETRKKVLQDRFNSSALDTNSIDHLSFFDALVLKIKSILEKVSVKLDKVKLIRLHSGLYEKYIHFDYHHIKTPTEYLVIKLILGLTSILLYHVLISKYKEGYILAFLLGYFITNLVLIINYHKRQEEIKKDLPLALNLLKEYLDKYDDISTSILEVSNAFKGGINKEFKKVYLDLSRGKDIDICFIDFYNRTEINEIKDIAENLTLCEKGSGSIKKALELSLNEINKQNKELMLFEIIYKGVLVVITSIPFILFIFLFKNKDKLKSLMTSHASITIFTIAFAIYLVILIRMVGEKSE